MGDNQNKSCVGWRTPRIPNLPPSNQSPVVSVAIQTPHQVLMPSLLQMSYNKATQGPQPSPSPTTVMTSVSWFAGEQLCSSMSVATNAPSAGNDSVSNAQDGFFSHQDTEFIKQGTIPSQQAQVPSQYCESNNNNNANNYLEPMCSTSATTEELLEQCDEAVNEILQTIFVNEQDWLSKMNDQALSSFRSPNVATTSAVNDPPQQQQQWTVNQLRQIQQSPQRQSQELLRPEIVLSQQYHLQHSQQQYQYPQQQPQQQPQPQPQHNHQKQHPQQQQQQHPHHQQQQQQQHPHHQQQQHQQHPLQQSRPQPPSEQQPSQQQTPQQRTLQQQPPQELQHLQRWLRGRRNSTPGSIEKSQEWPIFHGKRGNRGGRSNQAVNMELSATEKMLLQSDIALSEMLHCWTTSEERSRQDSEELRKKVVAVQVILRQHQQRLRHLQSNQK